MDLEGWTVELAACEATLLVEISCLECRRLDVVKTYCLAMQSSERLLVNWKRVNQAIVDRWSPHALNWIKKLAHSGECFR